jgi:hypothetical protein
MKRNLLSTLLSLLILSSYSQTAYREEFNGPFPSWANVKTRFKAAGDGKKDDTRALQQALDSLSRTLKVTYNTNSPGRYVVVYLPAGTYKISRTLRLEGKIGVSFIGEDPLKTIIKWEGGDDDTMFLSNRSAYLKISRITWDANNKKNIEALGIHYKDYIEPFFAPTSVELSDMIFTGKPKYGISCGTTAPEGTGTMDSEFAIKRCRFISCTEAGIHIKGYNALDYWIWDAEFNNCKIGVQCFYGNYHLYQSHFNDSQVADIYNRNGYYTSVRDCYSKNAAVFSLDEGAGCNAFKRIFQNNIVVGCKATAIQYHHLGKLSLMDNNFINELQPSPQIADYHTWCYGHSDILSVNNKYNAVKPFNLRQDFPSAIHSITDQYPEVKKALIKPVVRSLQPFIPYVKRQVFEIPANATSEVIQQVINKAAKAKGQRPIVHFAMGDYFLERSIVIPAESDMQIIGDGLLNASNLIKKNNSVDSYYVKIQGPSYITIKDLTIGREGYGGTAHGLLFTGVDQPSSEVFIDQIYTLSNRSLVIDKLNYTYFEKNNSFFSKGNIVTGGDKIKSGKGTSRLYCFGGQSAGTTLENNATMVAKDCWWEGSYRKEFLPLNLSGWGNLTIDGAMYAPRDNDSGAAVQINNFRGQVTLMNMYLIGSIFANRTPRDLKLLIWNINMYHKRNPFDFLKQKNAAGIAMLGISSQCFKSYDPGCADENIKSYPDQLLNVKQKNDFIYQLTRDDRKAVPGRYRNLPDGISNILISRVSVLTGTTAFTFRQ